MNELMAETCFELKQAGKDDAVVRVGLTAPMRQSISAPWQCSVLVHLPDETVCRIAQGTEPLEALVGACKMAIAEIRQLKSRFGKRIKSHGRQNLEVSLDAPIARI